jgi:exopolyphosphatase/guanosine-5'-triphosphate,3'-diphosphate pyrophosphatase
MLMHEDMVQTGPIEHGVIWALGRIGPPVASGHFRAVLGLEHLVANHPDRVARRVASEALARIEGKAPEAGPGPAGRYATIDIGTNSVKMLVAEPDGRGGSRVLADRTDIVRLGDELSSTGRIGDAAMERNLNLLDRYLAEARELGVERLAAVGTMCLRTAENAAVFIERAHTECGLEVEVISGEEEANLSFLAVQRGLGSLPGRLLVLDIGGGSTEFICGSEGGIDRRLSLELGAIRLTEGFLVSDPVTHHEVEAVLAQISSVLDAGLCGPDGPSSSGRSVDTLVGVGGTPTNLSAIKHGLSRYDPEVVRGSRLTRQEVVDMVELFRSRTVAERREIVGLEPKRADVILAGAAIVLAVMRRFECERITVSDQGVRHGLMAQRFGI